MAWKQFSFSSRFISIFFCFSFLLARRPDLGRGTLTFDEFCRVAVHFSDEDDEALQLSTSCQGWWVTLDWQIPSEWEYLGNNSSRCQFVSHRPCTLRKDFSLSRDDLWCITILTFHFATERSWRKLSGSTTKKVRTWIGAEWLSNSINHGFPFLSGPARLRIHPDVILARNLGSPRRPTDERPAER